MEHLLNNMRRIIPSSWFRQLQPIYHGSLACLGSIIYRNPSQHIKVIAVTGTKGKSSTTELINTILEQAGKKTAVSNTIRFKVGNDSEPNLYKMSMPGRMFMQKFIRRAVDAGCEYAVIEVTSQGALLFRHKYIDIDTFVFTNLSPEHIEAHGSYENYRASKMSITEGMPRSKKNTTIIVNGDDKEAEHFLARDVNKKIRYSTHDVEPYSLDNGHIVFTYKGVQFTSPLSGLFNLYNILAAITCTANENIPLETIKKALEKFSLIPGRVEEIHAGQDFKVIVDYAHTPDSLEKLYKVFRPNPSTKNTDKKKLFAILGGTGGGRDTWKRGEMGRLADLYCDVVILTDEDPYDEDPQKIVNDVASGVSTKKPIIEMDRRKAIRRALQMAAGKNDVVLITGKGTDPYIMGPKGSKLPWSDAKVAREELKNLN